MIIKMVELYLLITLIFLFGRIRIMYFLVIIFVVIIVTVKSLITELRFSLVRMIGCMDLVSWLLIIISLVLIVLTRCSMRNYLV